MNEFTLAAVGLPRSIYQKIVDSAPHLRESFKCFNYLQPSYEGFVNANKGRPPRYITAVVGEQNFPVAVREILAASNIECVNLTAGEKIGLFQFWEQVIYPVILGKPQMAIQSYNDESMLQYRRVNEKFREKLEREREPYAIIDHYLMLAAPKERKAKGAFFSISPHCSGHELRPLAEHPALEGFFTEGHEALARLDVVYHNSERWSANFKNACTYLSVPVRTTRCSTYSLGADKEYAQLYSKGVVREEVIKLKEKYAGRFPFLSVDRSDYIKGLIERLQVFDQVLDHAEARQKQPVFIVIADESRQADYEEYKEYRGLVANLAQTINCKQLAVLGYEPIVMLGGQNRETLVAYYAFLAEQGGAFVVSSLRDGFHRGAFEAMMVSDEVNKPIISLVSPFAGVSDYLPGALTFDPTNIGAAVDESRKALFMDSAERMTRWERNILSVRANDAASSAERAIGIFIATSDKTLGRRVANSNPSDVGLCPER